MSFENTKSSLAYLEQRGEITSFDIFNLFHNLCDDAEAMAHSKLEKMPCKYSRMFLFLLFDLKNTILLYYSTI